MRTPNKIGYFIFRLLVLVAIIAIADLIIGNTLRRLYFSQTSGFQYRTTYALEKTNEDILVFGSSRASHHYVPEVFENTLKQSFYNTGRDGHFIFYNTIVLQSVLKRYTPKIIILDFSAHSFEKNQDAYDRLSALLPYYKNHNEIRDVIELKSPYEKLKLISSIYPYNSSILSLLMRKLKKSYSTTDDIKGYLPLYGEIKNMDSMEIKHNKLEFDPKLIESFKKFIVSAKNRKIKVFVIVSPYYNPIEKDTSIELAQQICMEENISFLNYSSDTTFLKKKTFFKDNEHLNHNGAILYSEKISEIVKKSIVKE